MNLPLSRQRWCKREGRRSAKTKSDVLRDKATQERNLLQCSLSWVSTKKEENIPQVAIIKYQENIIRGGTKIPLTEKFGDMSPVSSQQTAILGFRRQTFRSCNLLFRWLVYQTGQNEEERKKERKKEGKKTHREAIRGRTIQFPDPQDSDNRRYAPLGCLPKKQERCPESPRWMAPAFPGTTSSSPSPPPRRRTFRHAGDSCGWRRSRPCKDQNLRPGGRYLNPHSYWSTCWEYLALVHGGRGTAAH